MNGNIGGTALQEIQGEMLALESSEDTCGVCVVLWAHLG
jgi:hypothetical protein